MKPFLLSLLALFYGAVFLLWKRKPRPKGK